MRNIDLIKLGFKDTSYVQEGIQFSEFTFQTDNLTVQVSDLKTVEIKITDGLWHHVPFCEKPRDIKKLISMFYKKN